MLITIQFRLAGPLTPDSDTGLSYAISSAETRLLDALYQGKLTAGFKGNVFGEKVATPIGTVRVDHE